MAIFFTKKQPVIPSADRAALCRGESKSKDLVPRLGSRKGDSAGKKRKVPRQSFLPLRVRKKWLGMTVQS